MNDVVREQLTRKQAEILPSHIPSWSQEYFEFERIDTGLSKEIITWGYREHEDKGNGHIKLGPWLKLDTIK